MNQPAQSFNEIVNGTDDNEPVPQEVPPVVNAEAVAAEQDAEKTLDELIAERKRVKRSITAREATVERAKKDLEECKQEFNHLTRLIHEAAISEVM